MNANTFIKALQEPSSLGKCTEELTKHQKALIILSRSLNSEDLISCLIKYIDYIINVVAVIEDYKEQISLSVEHMHVVQDIVLTNKSIYNNFMRKITEKIFSIIIEEDPKNWIIKKEILKMFTTCQKQCNKNLKNEIVQNLNKIYLLKLIDSISTFSDYDFQVILLELIFRMYGKSTINAKLKDIIPESQELSQKFSEISTTSFDEDVRCFLNILNKHSGRIYSIICKSIIFGNIRCVPPMDSVDGLWVDFNLSNDIITWYCIKDSFNEEGYKNEADSIAWTLITLFVSDVESINIIRSKDELRVCIEIKLKVQCTSVNDDVNNQLKYIRSIKMLFDSAEANHLVEYILPTIFPNSFPEDEVDNVEVIKTSEAPCYEIQRDEFSKLRKPKKIFDGNETGKLSGMDAIAAKSTTTRSESNSLNDLNHSTSRKPNETNDAISIHSSISSELSGVQKDIESIQILSGRCSRQTTQYVHFHTNKPFPNMSVSERSNDLNREGKSSVSKQINPRKIFSQHRQNTQHTSNEEYSTANEMLTTTYKTPRENSSTQAFHSADKFRERKMKPSTANAAIMKTGSVLVVSSLDQSHNSDDTSNKSIFVLSDDESNIPRDVKQTSKVFTKIKPVVKISVQKNNDVRKPDKKNKKKVDKTIPEMKQLDCIKISTVKIGEKFDEISDKSRDSVEILEDTPLSHTDPNEKIGKVSDVHTSQHDNDNMSAGKRRIDLIREGETKMQSPQKQNIQQSSSDEYSTANEIFTTTHKLPRENLSTQNTNAAVMRTDSLLAVSSLDQSHNSDELSNKSVLILSDDESNTLCDVGQTSKVVAKQAKKIDDVIRKVWSSKVKPRQENRDAKKTNERNRKEIEKANLQMDQLECYKISKVKIVKEFDEIFENSRESNEYSDEIIEVTPPSHTDPREKNKVHTSYLDSDNISVDKRNNDLVTKGKTKMVLQQKQNTQHYSNEKCSPANEMLATTVHKSPTGNSSSEDLLTADESIKRNIGSSSTTNAAMRTVNLLAVPSRDQSQNSDETPKESVSLLSHIVEKTTNQQIEQLDCIKISSEKATVPSDKFDNVTDVLTSQRNNDKKLVDKNSAVKSVTEDLRDSSDSEENSETNFKLYKSSKHKHLIPERHGNKDNHEALSNKQMNKQDDDRTYNGIYDAETETIETDDSQKKSTKEKKDKKSKKTQSDRNFEGEYDSDDSKENIVRSTPLKKLKSCKKPKLTTSRKDPRDCRIVNEIDKKIKENISQKTLIHYDERVNVTDSKKENAGKENEETVSVTQSAKTDEFKKDNDDFKEIMANVKKMNKSKKRKTDNVTDVEISQNILKDNDEKLKDINITEEKDDMQFSENINNFKIDPNNIGCKIEQIENLCGEILTGTNSKVHSLTDSNKKIKKACPIFELVDDKQRRDSLLSNDSSRSEILKSESAIDKSTFPLRMPTVIEKVRQKKQTLEIEREFDYEIISSSSDSIEKPSNKKINVISDVRIIPKKQNEAKKLQEYKPVGLELRVVLQRVDTYRHLSRYKIENDHRELYVPDDNNDVIVSPDVLEVVNKSYECIEDRIEEIPNDQQCVPNIPDDKKDSTVSPDVFENVNKTFEGIEDRLEEIENDQRCLLNIPDDNDDVIVSPDVFEEFNKNCELIEDRIEIIEEDNAKFDVENGETIADESKIHKTQSAQNVEGEYDSDDSKESIVRRKLLKKSEKCEKMEVTTLRKDWRDCRIVIERDNKIKDKIVQKTLIDNDKMCNGIESTKEIEGIENKEMVSVTQLAKQAELENDDFKEYIANVKKLKKSKKNVTTETSKDVQISENILKGNEENVNLTGKNYAIEFNENVLFDVENNETIADDSKSRKADTDSESISQITAEVNRIYGMTENNGGNEKKDKGSKETLSTQSVQGDYDGDNSKENILRSMTLKKSKNRKSKLPSSRKGGKKFRIVIDNDKNIEKKIFQKTPIANDKILNDVNSRTGNEGKENREVAPVTQLDDNDGSKNNNDDFKEVTVNVEKVKNSNVTEANKYVEISQNIRKDDEVKLEDVVNITDKKDDVECNKIAIFDVENKVTIIDESKTRKDEINENNKEVEDDQISEKSTSDYFDEEFPLNPVTGPKPIINPEIAFDELVNEKNTRENDEQTLGKILKRQTTKNKSTVVQFDLEKKTATDVTEKNEIIVKAQVHATSDTPKRALALQQAPMIENCDNKTLENVNEMPVRKFMDLNKTSSTTISYRSGKRKRLLYDPNVPVEQYIVDASIYNKSNVSELQQDKTQNANNNKFDEITRIEEVDENDKEVESILSGKLGKEKPIFEEELAMNKSTEKKKELETKGKTTKAGVKYQTGKIIKKRNTVIVNTNVSFHGKHKKMPHLGLAFQEMLDSLREELGGKTLLEEMDTKRSRASRTIPSAKKKDKKTVTRLSKEMLKRNSLVSLRTPLMTNTKKNLVENSSTSSADENKPHKRKILEERYKTSKRKKQHKDILKTKKASLENKNIFESNRFDQTDIDLNNDDFDVIPKKLQRLENLEAYPINDVAVVSKPTPSWKGAAVLNEKFVTLTSADFLGKYLVLFFYPLDFGFHPYAHEPVEVIAFNEIIEEFRSINCEVVACSVDSQYTHLAWIRNTKDKGIFQELKITLLSDTNHDISKAYGVYMPEWGHTIRSLFITNREGKLEMKFLLNTPFKIDVKHVIEQVKSIQSIEKDLE